MTWKSGCRLRLRSGCSSSTRRSNGRSWWAQAPSAVRWTRATRSRNDGSPEKSERRTRVLTKNPISPSNSTRGRPATAVPTGMSSRPVTRCSSAWKAASSVTKRVTPSARLNCRSASDSRAERAKGRRPPDRKSTRLNSSHRTISYAVFCLKKKKQHEHPHRESPAAVIAAGTGLGHPTHLSAGEQYHPIASKGAPADVAPRTDQHTELQLHV